MTLWPMMMRAFVLVCLFSCGFGEFASVLGATPSQPGPLMESVARIHWIGKDSISTNTAADFMRVWEMPETVKLQQQTLDKLSAAPWRYIRGQSNPASTNLLHPLLQDLIDHEFYLEIDQPANSTNQPGELVLAVRLTDSRARLWETNIAAILESLTPLRMDNSSSGRRSLKKHHIPNLIEITRVGQWTVLGAAQDHNTLLDQGVARIEAGLSPFATRDTNSWFEAEVDIGRAAAAMGHAFMKLPPNFPAVSLSIAGDSNATRTRGDLIFPEPVPLRLESWNIPTNLISADFIDFTAIRGGSPSFLSKFWKQFNTNPAPNQFFVWSLIGAPMESYVAAPVADASNAVLHLGDFLLQRSASSFPANDLISFQKVKGSNTLRWSGVPYISPCLEFAETPSGSFVLIGLFTPMAPGNPLPPELSQHLQGQKNLLYYSSELTGAKVQQLTFLSQLARMIMRKSQLPAQSTAMLWLKALGQDLGQSHTEMTCDGSRRFSFDRTGTTPLTALEMQLLADWVESSHFPALGLYSLEGR